MKYTVLDNFFREEKLDQLISYHLGLEFSEFCDKYSHEGELLPYDSAVNFARQGQGLGSELYYNPEWLQYLADICELPFSPNVEVKQRYHAGDAGGFWIHSDAATRNIAAIGYFNKGWKASDGGLLQLWMVDSANDPQTLEVNSPIGRMTMLESLTRIKTQTPGGGFPDNQPHDLILIDQIVPLYNRLFICNNIAAPSYHSVSPSNGKIRLGFVQWVLKP